MTSIFSHSGVSVAISTRRDGSMMKNKQIISDTVGTFLKKQKLNSHLVTMNQVHGNTVRVVDSEDTPIAETDGLITKQTGVTLGVVTADCLPILLFDPEQMIIGAVHAGFRGVYADVIPNALRTMIKMGANPSDILVGIGPAIGPCCYSVDKLRSDSFTEKFGGNVVLSRNDRQFLDLPLIAHQQLAKLGVLSENIDNMGICTSCNNHTYFSYRADPDEKFGEMISVITLL